VEVVVRANSDTVAFTAPLPKKGPGRKVSTASAGTAK